MNAPVGRSGRTCLTRPTGPWRAAAAAALLLLVGAAPRPASAAAAQDRLIVGLKAYQDGFHDLAAKELRAFLAAAPQDPRRPDVLYVLAQAELARQDWGAARRALQELAGAGGSRAAEAHYWLGWLAAREDKPAEALGNLERYLATEGGSRRTDALFLAADAARRLGQGAAAADRFGRFLEAAPADSRRATAWEGRVQGLAEVSPARAIGAARQGLADPAVKADRDVAEAVALAGVRAARAAGDPAAEAAFWRLLAEGGQEGDRRQDARFEEGAALARAGDGAGARRALGAYVEAAPSGARATEARLLLADLARQAGDRADALAQLEAGLTRPDDPAVKPRLTGLRLAALGLAVGLDAGERAAGHARELLSGEEALGAEDRALVRMTLAGAATNPREALAHWDAVPAGTSRTRAARLLAARALLDARRPAEALERLTPLLKLEPDQGSEAHLTALAAAEAAGEHGRAARLSVWLADHPPPGESGAGYLYRGLLALRRGEDPAGYARGLEGFAERFPGDSRMPWVAEELARLAHGRADWEGVLRWSAQADPASAAVALRRGEALERLGRGAEAGEVFAALASREGPLRPQAMARLGALHDREGDRDEALAAYRGALAAGLGGEAALWVRDRIAALEAGPLR